MRKLEPNPLKLQSVVVTRIIGPPPRAGFTLIELLTTIAIIAVLAGLLLPALARAKEKAKVAKVQGELYCVGLALEMYADDHEGELPPVRVNCNSDLAAHWCQFPVELATAGYLPKGTNQVMAANMEDVFNRGHTYKYAAPGKSLLNGSEGARYSLWVPDDFPRSTSTNGAYYMDPKTSPVRWVIWSLGPRPNSAESQHAHAPLASQSWYRRTGGGGVIARISSREGMPIQTP
jgi:prepilin-type N-terminal cleavage/methylation domain-containing protein